MNQARWPGGPERGPFRVDQLHEGDRYELSDGHALYCAPAGPRHGRPHALGALPLASDPAVAEIGADVGHALGEGTLRAPDLSVGDLGEGEGTWASGAPPLAIEYAAQGQDEADLQTKIRQLLAAGTRYVWVVRLVGPRRVEIYEAGSTVRTKGPGERLEAPGVLKNAPLVEALYEREAAFEQTLQNLLERRGYAGLEAVRAEGDARGEARGEARGLGPLRRVYSRRLGRALTEGEALELGRRLAALGPERLGDAALDLNPDELAAWLADPAGR